MNFPSNHRRPGLRDLGLRGLCLVGVLAVLAPASRAAPLSPQRVDELRARIRADFFVPDPLPALEAQVHRRFAPAPGVRAEALTYATEFGLRVPAVLYLPDPLPPGGRIPGFVVVNGHGGDKHSWYAYYAGIVYARAGAAVLTYDPAGEAERNDERKSGTREHDRLQGGPVMARRLCGLMITDVMQAVSYLASRPEVDASRLGAGGYSLGSFVLALAGAVDPRLHACVLVGGGNLDGPGGFWDRSHKPMCQGLPYQSLDFLGDRPAVLYALHAARGPLLIWNGRDDHAVNVTHTQEAFFDDLRRRVIALHGGPVGVFDFGFTAGGGHRPYFLTRPAAAWLERQLQFPNWTEASVSTLPETHLSEWSKQTGVPIDRLYASELREGGTMAIGTDVPGFRYADLWVFSPEEWERVRPQYVFSTWVERARTASADERAAP